MEATLVEVGDFVATAASGATEEGTISTIDLSTVTSVEALC
jgi:hypothetical protein